MNSINFSDDQLALIYEAIRHMTSFRSVLDVDNYIGNISRDILHQIECKNQKLSSSFYVSENILD